MTGRLDDAKKGITEKKEGSGSRAQGRGECWKGGKATSPMVTGFKAECVSMDVGRLKHCCREGKVALS